MKYLVLVLIVVAVIMLTRWSRPRRDAERAPDAAPPPVAIPAEAMLACAHCGVHLPRGEALPGRGGVYCSTAHRALHEAQPPADHE